MILSENWNCIDTLSVDQACEMFTSKIHQLMSQCIPSKIITVRRNDKPWYDSEIRRHSKYRDRQKRLMLTKPSLSNTSKYKKLRNKVNNLKKFAKKQFLANIENKIEDYSINSNIIGSQLKL